MSSHINTTLEQGNYWKLLKSLTTNFPSPSLWDKLPINLFTCCLRGPLQAQMEDGNVNNPPAVSLPHNIPAGQTPLNVSLWLWMLTSPTASSVFMVEAGGISISRLERFIKVKRIPCVIVCIIRTCFNFQGCTAWTTSIIPYIS